MPMGIGPGLSVTRGGSVTGIGAIGADLALWFDENQAYKSSGGGVVTPDSILTYTAPSPKLVYGTTGVLGYAPHNLQVYSNDFANAAWVKNFSTVNAEGTAPDGSTATKLTNDTSNAAHGVYDALVLSAPYNFSVYMKAGTAQYGGIASRTSNCSVTFDLSAGTIVASVGASGTIEAAGDGWYRCSMKPTTLASTNFIVSVLESSAVAPWAAYVGTTKDIYIWNAQASLGSSALTYIPTTTAAVYSLPRDHNPTTGAALGVLVEDARTNLQVQSQTIGGTGWGLISSCTATLNSAVAPDGTTTMSLLTGSASDSSRAQSQASITISTATSYTTSVYLKAGTSTLSRVAVFNGGVTVTLGTVTINWTAGVPSTSSSSGASNITYTDVGNGIYRLSFTFSSGAETSAVLLLYPDRNAVSATVYLWGAQLEAGAFATSYIPTVASQVTRAADQISILTSAFPWTNAQGTMVADFTPVYADNGLAIEFMAFTAYTTNIHFIQAFINTTTTRAGQPSFQYRNSTSVLVLGGANDLSPPNPGQQKWGLSFEASSIFRTSRQGLALGAEAALVVTASPVTLWLGSSINGTLSINGHIKRFAHYASLKSQAELNTLTAL